MPPSHICLIWLWQSIEDSDRQAKDEELVICALRQWSISECKYWALRKFTGNWRDAKELLGLYEDIVSYYVYLIWESKMKTLRKHMKIISEV